MKRLTITLMLLATALVARAFDFSEVAPSGQTLYYDITSGNTVKVVSGTPKPTGRLTIPATAQGYAVTEIASMAFNGCTGLTAVSIPGSVTTIGMRAFANCSSLTSAVLAEGVQTIGLMAFSGCTALDTVSLPTTLTQINSGCFGNTALMNNDDHWSNSILYIGRYLIAARNTLDGVLSVADSTIGIGNNALFSCNITTVTLPAELQFIGNLAFKSCMMLDTVRLLGTIPPALGDDSFQDVPEGLVAFVPCSTAVAYSEAPYWSDLIIVEDTCPTPPTPPDPPVSLQEVGTPQFSATINGNILTVSGAEGQFLIVTDMLGRRIHSATCAQHDMHVALPAKGLYIVSVGTLAPLKVCYSR